jgi:hypothetical protein
MDELIRELKMLPIVLFTKNALLICVAKSKTLLKPVISFD